jgi:RNA polymerase sigma-70 factor (ECF subfamily)
VTAQSIRAPVAEAVAGLAPPDRHVLLLIAWEQLSYDEVARAFNIPVGTVRSRLHRARTKIREASSLAEVAA